VIHLNPTCEADQNHLQTDSHPIDSGQLIDIYFEKRLGLYQVDVDSNISFGLGFRLLFL
jgi:hypothetical protein